MSSSVPGRRYVLNGSSFQMIVNGSVTPVDFTAAPPAGEIWEMTDLSVVMTGAGNINQVLTNFFARPNLTNGIQVIYNINNVVTTAVNTVQTNHDLLSVFGVTFFGKIIGTSNVCTGKVKFRKLTLNGSLGDYFRIRIRDDLTSLETFSAILEGTIITV